MYSIFLQSVHAFQNEGSCNTFKALRRAIMKYYLNQECCPKLKPLLYHLTERMFDEPWLLQKAFEYIDNERSTISQFGEI